MKVQFKFFILNYFHFVLFDYKFQNNSFPVKSEIDVVIDFSSPELFRKTLKWATENKVPMVSGTTGITEEDLATLKVSSKIIPILWSANMSPGLNLLLELIPKLAVLEDYDFQVEEFHHKHKLDRPSGTAKMLQEELKVHLKKEIPEPMVGRGGGIFGIHKVWMMTDEEYLIIEHTALNRKIFARGALRCAEWLINQSSGLYKMRDMMGFGGK